MKYLCVYISWFPDEDRFGPEASALLEQMVQNQLLQAQILMHEEDGVPYIQLYRIQGDKVGMTMLCSTITLLKGFRQNAAKIV